MKARFSVDVDLTNSLVRITLAGFFEAADIARLAQARDQAHRQLRCAANEHLTLVDMRDMEIQAQDSVGRFQAIMADPAIRSKRLAFVVSKSLARMQIKRAASGRCAGYFLDLESAEAWLYADDAEPAPDIVITIEET